MTDDLSAQNALHAAEAWLQREETWRDAVAVVTVWPRACIGIWREGLADVQLLPLDDAGAEVAEAVAPVVDRALLELPEPARQAVAAAVRGGARLQVLLSPTERGIVLRLVAAAGAVEVTRIEMVDRVH